MDVPADGGIDGRHHGEVDLALVDGREQRVGRRSLHRHPADLGMVAAHLREHALDARRLVVRDFRAGQVLEAARPEAVARMDDDGFGGLVTRGPQERRVRASRRRDRLHALRAEEAADADVRLAGDDAFDERAGVGHGDDGQRKVFFAREPRDQIMIEALGRAIGAGEPARRTGTHRDDQRLCFLRRRKLGHAAGGDEGGQCERRQLRGPARRTGQHGLARAMSLGSASMRASVDGGGRSNRCDGRGPAGL